MNIAEAVEKHAAERPSIEVPLSEILKNYSGPPELKFRVRPLVMEDDFTATAEAVKYRKATFADISETHIKRLLEDPEFFDDARQIEKLYLACRDAEDLSKPAFPSSEWMRKKFIAQEMNIIGEWYGRAVREAAKVAVPVTAEQHNSLVEGCAATADTPYPDRMLAGLPRATVASEFIQASVEIVALRDEIKVLREEIAALKAA